jgi:hypothetical protein
LRHDPNSDEADKVASVFSSMGSQSAPAPRFLEDGEAKARPIHRAIEVGDRGVRISAHAAAALDASDDGRSVNVHPLDVTVPAGELHGLSLARMIEIRFRNARGALVAASRWPDPRAEFIDGATLPWRD